MGRKKKAKVPRTRALVALDAQKVDYTVHTYDYVERGGTRASSAALGVALHQVIKTLVFEDDRKYADHLRRRPGVSAKGLARALGRRSVQPCDPATAQRHSGYQVGGTSPFGTSGHAPLRGAEHPRPRPHLDQRRRARAAGEPRSGGVRRRLQRRRSAATTRG